MSELWIYLELGFRHIADIAGYDHILFVAALTLGHRLSDWRRLALLVTAFTVGHSISLAAATLDAIRISPALIEVLIPATIIATAAHAIIEQHGRTRLSRQQPRRSATGIRYVLVAIFGLVHGLGFSSYLRALLGRTESIVSELLAFNIGLELGQLLILGIVLMVGAFAVRVFLTERDWVHLIGGATSGIALVLLVERLADVLR